MSAEARRRRKQWLFEVWAADVVRVEIAYAFGGGTFKQDLENYRDWSTFEGYVGQEALVRCFRCGKTCSWDEVEVDWIKPGCDGGRYTRNNIRPCCPRCNTWLGEQAKKRKAERRAKRAAQQRAYRARKKAALAR